MNELRKDWMNNDVIILAKDRAKRPMDKSKCENDKEIFNDYEINCPFCRSNENLTPNETFKIEEDNKWIVRCTNNKYPIVDDKCNDIYGFHEVMIDTYRHNGNFYNMTLEEFINLLIMYKHRYTEFVNKKNVEYISIFKNFLRRGGASLDHPHSQIISMSLVPADIENEIAIAKDYYNTNNTCLYNDIIKKEIEYKKRVINDSRKFLVIAPYASRYAGEIRILFKENIRFEKIDDSYIEELGSILYKLFKNLYKNNGYCPFNIYIHTHPVNTNCDEYFNVHIHIVSRKYNYGGFELSTGMYVSSIDPEEFTKNIKFD